MSIAKRVCQERGWQLGNLIGYQVSLDKVASEDTRLLFVTTGVLLQKLINQKDMNEYTHILLDEVGSYLYYQQICYCGVCMCV